MDDSQLANFQAIFREHYPSVLRRIVALIGDRAAAEDLAQEAFLRLYRHPPDDLGKVGPWLHRVLTRIVYDHLRKSGRDEKLHERQVRHLHTQEAAVPSHEDFVIREWERDVVRQVLAKLSERDRQALLMKENGYSHAEIAEALAVNPRIVSTLLIRAEQRFKRKMTYGELMDP